MFWRTAYGCIMTLHFWFALYGRQHLCIVRCGVCICGFRTKFHLLCRGPHFLSEYGGPTPTLMGGRMLNELDREYGRLATVAYFVDLVVFLAFLLF